MTAQVQIGAGQGTYLLTLDDVEARDSAGKVIGLSITSDQVIVTGEMGPTILLSSNKDILGRFSLGSRP